MDQNGVLNWTRNRQPVFWTPKDHYLNDPFETESQLEDPKQPAPAFDGLTLEAVETVEESAR